ncbi:MAG: glycosyltransferase N-terminal domain-containing protein [Nitrospinota bacterium]|nr:glycosyltransferase N-terminal domain-containing protein [Nitrospinota bacterium]
MIIYKILSVIFSLILSPLFAVHSLVTGKKRRGLGNRFGLTPKVDRSETRFRKTLWLYALSVGEVWAAVPVLQQVRQLRPEIRIVVSTTTDAGYDAAKNQLGFVEKIFYQPLDLWPFPEMAVSRIQPNIFVLTETSFWPGLFHVLEQSNIPALLFQGRISKKSLHRYRKIVPLMSRVLNSFRILCMMTENGAEDLRSLAVEPSKVKVIGSTRFDSLQTVSSTERERIRSALKITSGRPVFVAGSTHEGEEEIILDVFRRLRQRYETLTLVLAPRRMERVPEIEQMMKARTISFTKRSEQSVNGEGTASVILLDTMGELMGVYSVADVVFVGHSLLPPGGGHSLIEPASHGKVVLHGPYVEYNQKDADEMKNLGVAFTVSDASGMEDTLKMLLDDAPRRQALGLKAQALIEENKGAAQKMAGLIFETLDGPSLQQMGPGKSI